jgi:hypothetical protein
MPARDNIASANDNVESDVLKTSHRDVLASEVLGKTGIRALESLGLKAKSCRFEMVRDKLRLVIDVE